MAPDLTLELVCRVVGVAIAAAAVLLVAWGRLWDRARGRRRCPRCWYDMAGVPGLTCPECGRTAKSERALGRTRRRRWTVGAALAMVVVAQVTWRTPEVWERGWAAAVPTTVLIPVVTMIEPFEQPPPPPGSLTPPQPGRWASELSSRLFEGELAGWQWRWLLRRMGYTRSRSKWPGDRPWRPIIALPDWFRLKGSLRATAMGVVLPQSRRFALQQSPPGDGAVNLPPGTRSVPVEVEFTAYTGPGSPPRVLWSGVLDVPVLAVGSDREALEPDSSDELAAAIRQGASLIVNYRSRHHSRWATLDLTLDLDAHPRLRQLAPGFQMELLRDGEIFQEPLGVSISAAPGPNLNMYSGWIRSHLPWRSRDPQEIHRWSLRIRGDLEAALFTHRGTVYWDGEWIIPVSELEVVEEGY